MLEYFREDEIVNLFADGKPAYMIMREDDFKAVRSKLPPEAHIINTRPLLQIRLNTFFKRGERPEVVLVTNQETATDTFHVDSSP